MKIEGDLVLGTAADTQGSGGYISGVMLTGRLNFTMQQQWIARNCEIGDEGFSYFEDPPRSVNFVFVGTTGVTPEQTTTCTNSGANPVSPSPQKLVVPQTPVTVEKPYITIDQQGKYHLITPKSVFSSKGVQWATGSDDAYTDGFEKVFVATNETAATDINAKLAQGLHVVLTPGIYFLAEPIRIGRAGSPYQVANPGTVNPLHPSHFCRRFNRKGERGCQRINGIRIG